MIKRSLSGHSRQRARRQIASLLAPALLLFTPAFAVPLGAGPVLKIESISTDRYPLLEARAELHHPYPETIKHQESRFDVRERSESGPPDLYNEAMLQSIQELPAPETRLYLVLVLDTTRSVPKKAFRKSIQTSVRLVRSLKEGESAAIYRINARPLLASGFVSDQEALVKTLRSFKRNGRVTRLYDSLHSAVITAHKTALAAKDSPPGVREKTAIILLTDGRDEGSFLTDSDCVELAALSHSYDIPVYTILYGNSKNLASLTRLSARTGGTLIRGFDEERIEKIPEELREPTSRFFRVRFNTMTDPGGFWPIGDTIKVKLGYNAPASMDGAEGSYKIPFPRGLMLYASRENMMMYAIGAGLLLFGLLLLLLLLLLWLRARGRRRLKRKVENELVEHETMVVDSDLYGDESDLPVVPAEEIDDSVPPVVEEDDDFFVDTEADAAMVRPNDFPAAPPLAVVERGRRHAESRADLEEDLLQTDLVREKQRIMRPVREAPSEVYMRDYSYRMLQNALRQAQRYGEASLLRENSRQGISEYDIFLETTILGSGRWANIHLEDPAASPIHAKIRQVDHRFVIYDMLSAAGVYLNGRKILRPMPLTDGDRIQLGRTLLEFRGVV